MELTPGSSCQGVVVRHGFNVRDILDLSEGEGQWVGQESGWGEEGGEFLFRNWQVPKYLAGF